MEILDSGMKYSLINVPINGANPGNKKFYVVIRLLDERITSENNRFIIFIIIPDV
jgi:hypothetical protein